jgi:hypothetical protein
MTQAAPIALPYRFDTSDVWHTILKGAFGLNALLLLSLVFAIFARPWPVTLGLGVMELTVLGFTRIFVRNQQGSTGTLTTDRVEVEPNTLLGIALPGPRGTYTLDRFSAAPPPRGGDRRAHRDPLVRPRTRRASVMSRSYRPTPTGIGRTMQD